MMAIVDAKYRFIWASVGFPGNVHDSVSLQSTELWHEITWNNVIPSMVKTIEGTEVIQPFHLEFGLWNPMLMPI